MLSMRLTTLVILILIFCQSHLMAKTMCSIPIEGASVQHKDNILLNDRLKAHQKMKSVSFAIDIENLKSDGNSKVQLVFETVQLKKFETMYNFYNKNVNVWKIDFSKSQIFPQLFKNYMNITQFNSKFYLRLYDTPAEKTIVSLTFDLSNCSESKSNLLTRARVAL